MLARRQHAHDGALAELVGQTAQQSAAAFASPRPIRPHRPGEAVAAAWYVNVREHGDVVGAEAEAALLLLPWSAVTASGAAPGRRDGGRTGVEDDGQDDDADDGDECADARVLQRRRRRVAGHGLIDGRRRASESETSRRRRRRAAAMWHAGDVAGKWWGGGGGFGCARYMEVGRSMICVWDSRAVAIEFRIGRMAWQARSV